MGPIRSPFVNGSANLPSRSVGMSLPHLGARITRACRQQVNLAGNNRRHRTRGRARHRLRKITHSLARHQTGSKGSSTYSRVTRRLPCTYSRQASSSIHQVRLLSRRTRRRNLRTVSSRHRSNPLQVAKGRVTRHQTGATSGTTRP